MVDSDVCKVVEALLIDGGASCAEWCLTFAKLGVLEAIGFDQVIAINPLLDDTLFGETWSSLEVSEEHLGTSIFLLIQ